jgi:cell wall-associated NlpC family hydrolase
MDASDLQHELTAAAAGNVDPRLAFARARAEPGGTWCIESSHRGWLDAALVRLQRRGVEVSGRLLEPWSERSAWVAASVAEVRREPRHTSEQISQALQGETLQPFVHEEGWVLGRLADGYFGWVRDWHLHLVERDVPAAFAARTDARVDAGVVTVRAAPQRDAAAVSETILGTAVACWRDERNWTEIELPAGRRGWVPRAALRPGTGSWPPGAAAILATVNRFVGVPYLWGGRSPKGFDCSGLVQFVFALHGVALPRDSDQQAECGQAVDRAAAGDLIFFGQERVSHVAIAAAGDTFLHARGEVR